MPRWSGKFRIPIASFIRPSLQSQIISALILCEDDVSWRAVMALAVMVEVCSTHYFNDFLGKTQYGVEMGRSHSSRKPFARICTVLASQESILTKSRNCRESVHGKLK